MAQEADGGLLYVDVSDTFSETFTTELDEIKPTHVETAGDAAALETSYDLVVVSDAVSNWQQAIRSLKIPAVDVVLLTDSVDSLDEASSLGIDDCLHRENPALQAELLSRRLADDFSGISGRSQREADRLQSYERLIESDELILYELDEDGYLTVASPEFANRVGEHRERVVGSHVSEYLSEDDIENGRTILTALTEDSSREWESFELSIEHDDGRYWYLNHVTPILDDEGEFCGSMGVMHDITDRKEREDELELYEAMIQSIPEPVWAIDEDGYFIFANESYDKFGLTSEDIVGSHVKRWFTADGYERIRRAIFELLASDGTESHIGEYQLEAFGVSRPFNIHLSLMNPETTDLQGTVGMLRDITERKEREQRLNVLNRVFRHNIRNSLTVVKGRAQVIDDNGSENVQQEAAHIVEQANRLEQLSEKAKSVGEILNRKPDRRKRDVVGVVSGVIDSFDGDGVEIRFSAPESAQAYYIDGLRFAVENLVENAIEHNERTDLIVDVTIEEDEEAVTITVADNGEGIPETELSAIQRGREADLVHGSGLGLWVVHWIVHRSAGELTFGASELGGAAVAIDLPRRA